jgi:tRNA A-37 threonylcarbamoyl transferase component Bud32
VGPGVEVAKRFRLERQLGEGGMGAVWAATHIVTHKAVALKFLHKKHDDPDARRRVLREARAACAVQHPNVVSVHDVVEDEDGTPIIVMDLLRGESLADKLAREGTLAPAEAIAIMTPVLSALTVAHGVGIVHRDLKPDNVFLVEGVSANVRILDFGVAKLSGKDAATKETNQLTQTGAMIGTPHYMSPEQAFGESDVDARADLWAVGAVLYECLAGVPPTDGQNLGQILKVLASGSIRPLSVRAPAVPRAVAAVVDGLLQIEKEQRPSSAAVVLEQLGAIGPAELAAGPQPSVATDAGVPAVRSATMALAPNTGARHPTMELSSGMAGTFGPMSVTPAPATASKPKRRAPWIAGTAAVVVLASAAGIFGVRFRASSASTSNAAAAVTAAPVAPPPDPAPSAAPEPAPAAAAPAAQPVASAASSAKKGSGRPAASTKVATARPAAAPAAAAAAGKSSGGTPLIAEPTF